MSSIEYIDQCYRITFDAVHEALTEMVRRDPEGARLHLQGVLKSLYVLQGNDWSGRGVIGDTGINASIAAHEAVLAAIPAHDQAAGRNRARRSLPQRGAARRNRTTKQRTKGDKLSETRETPWAHGA